MQTKEAIMARDKSNPDQSDPPAEANAVNILHNASCAYNRALQNAWERASLDASKAANDLSESYQRIALNIGSSRSAAHRDWAEALRGATNQSEAAQRAEGANRSYHDALMTVFKEGQGNWDETVKAHQQAISAVNEAYADAAKAAFKAYLAEIKGIWDKSDLEQIDGAALAKLAEVTNYAAHVAQSFFRS
jgi:hypothetical protein